MTNNIEASVKKAIANQKHIEIEGISVDSSLADLGISSLDAITIVYEIEELFDIEVPNDQLENLQSVKDIIYGIEGLIAAKH